MKNARMLCESQDRNAILAVPLANLSYFCCAPVRRLRDNLGSGPPRDLRRPDRGSYPIPIQMGWKTCGGVEYAE